MQIANVKLDLSSAIETNVYSTIFIVNKHFVRTIPDIMFLKMIYILNTNTLKYVDYIDLAAYECTPTNILYQPIGGILRVICTNGDTSHYIAISEESNDVIDFEEGI